MQAIGTFLQIVEYGTMALLVCLSVWSIGIIVERRRAFRGLFDPANFVTAEEKIRSGETQSLQNWAKNQSGLVPGLVLAILESRQKPINIDAAVRSYLQKRREELEKGLSVLATLGSNAPFIGLFGTVLGIIEAFTALSMDQAGSGAVMASIAEALLATAAGLFVAIPAVVAFNYFSNRLRQILARADAMKNFYLSRLDAGKKAA